MKPAIPASDLRSRRSIDPHIRDQRDTDEPEELLTIDGDMILTVVALLWLTPVACNSVWLATPVLRRECRNGLPATLTAMWPSWREATERALYAGDGFYLRTRPAA